MNALVLARLQSATTAIYHFFSVPLILGLSILVAIVETLYVRTGDEVYKRLKVLGQAIPYQPAVPRSHVRCRG